MNPTNTIAAAIRDTKWKLWSTRVDMDSYMELGKLDLWKVAQVEYQRAASDLEVLEAQQQMLKEEKFERNGE